MSPTLFAALLQSVKTSCGTSPNSEEDKQLEETKSVSTTTTSLQKLAKVYKIKCVILTICVELKATDPSQNQMVKSVYISNISGHTITTNARK